MRSSRHLMVTGIDGQTSLRQSAVTGVNTVMVQIMTKFNICVLPGDGIGPEVTQEAVRMSAICGGIARLRFSFH